MPPAISRKEDRFQSYRSGYHEVAPALDGLCKKAHFVIGMNLESVYLNANDLTTVAIHGMNQKSC